MIQSQRNDKNLIRWYFVLNVSSAFYMIKGGIRAFIRRISSTLVLHHHLPERRRYNMLRRLLPITRFAIPSTYALRDRERCRGLYDPSGERTHEPPASTKRNPLDVPRERRADAASVVAVVMILLESYPPAMVTHGIREQAGVRYAVLHRMRIGYVDASLDEEGRYPHETES